MLNFKISRKEASPAQRELARNLRGGLPDKWGYSVSGPSYEFTKAVTDKLAMAGLTRIDKGTGPQVWSVVPSISPPPTYLSRVIGTFAKVKEAPDLQRKIDAAISSRGAVRQDMFGLDEGTPAGVRALVVGMAGRNFVANCDAKDHDRAAFLEAAGFRPKPFDASNPAHLPFIERYGNRPWVTTESILAMNLLPWMTAKAREELKLRLAEDAKRKKDSHRNDAPEDGWTFPVPDTLPEGWKPFGFQYRGVKNALASIAMAKRGGALIGDDMGLGKTIQAIGVLSSKPDYKRVLIVCKSNMKEKWKSEIQTWMARAEMPEIGIWSGRDTPMPDTPFVIVNYEITPDHMDELHGVEWDCVILDEAHNVTNEEAQRTKALLGNDVDDLAMLPIREGGALLELTGTLPSKIERLWPLVSRARPDIFGSGYQDRLRFMNRYAPANLIAKTFRKTDHRGKESEFVRLIPIETTPMRMAELQIRLRASGALTARLKEDMDGILPPKSRFPVELPFRFTEAEIDELKALEGDIEKVMDRISLDVGLEGLAAVADPAERARRIIDIFDTKMEEIKGRPEFYEISRLRARIGLIKAPYVARYVIDETLGDEDIDPEVRPKTVIYAHHADVISRIRDELEEQFPGSTIVYDGKVTTDAKRKKLVDQFQNDNRKRFFIMSQSGATGITLTRACRLYVAETDWDPQNAAQIEDRIWRIGQMLPVLIGYMYVPGSYDLHVGMTVMRKMEITMRLYHDLDLSGQGIPSDQRKKKAQPAPEGVEPA